MIQKVELIVVIHVLIMWQKKGNKLSESCLKLLNKCSVCGNGVLTERRFMDSWDHVLFIQCNG